MNLFNLLGRPASLSRGRRGVSGGIKGLAAVAVGRWLYKKWMSNRTRKHSGSLGRI